MSKMKKSSSGLARATQTSRMLYQSNMQTSRIQFPDDDKSTDTEDLDWSYTDNEFEDGEMEDTRIGAQMAILTLKESESVNSLARKPPMSNTPTKTKSDNVVLDNAESEGAMNMSDSVKSLNGHLELAESITATADIIDVGPGPMFAKDFIPEFMITEKEGVIRVIPVKFPNYPAAWIDAIAVFTVEGVFRVYFRNGKGILFQGKTDMSEVVMGDVYFGRSESEASYVFLQNRKEPMGIFSFKPQDFLSDIRRIPTSLDRHRGFCKFHLAQGNLFFPIHSSQVGAVSVWELSEYLGNEGGLRKDDVIKAVGFEGQIGPGPSTSKGLPLTLNQSDVMFITTLSYPNPRKTNGQDFIVVGREDGTIEAIKINWNSMKLMDYSNPPWASINLTEERRKLHLFKEAYESSDVVTPICGEQYLSKTGIGLVIGSTSRILFKVKLLLDEQEFVIDGLTTVPNRGIASVSLHPDGLNLAVGGWDGCVRLFTFPELFPLHSIPNYFGCEITSIKFLPDKQDKSKNYFIVTCGADTNEIAVWNLDRYKNKGF